MRKTVLYIAMSLDGFIADDQGRIDWLQAQQDSAENTVGWDEFAASVDTVIMGRKTWHQIVTELSPQQWVYEDFTTYVITHHPLPSSESVRFTDRDPVELVRALRSVAGGQIWICGGASIIGRLLEAEQIDRFHITVIPVLLGNGIRLFERGRRLPLKLVRVSRTGGACEMIFEKQTRKQ